MPRRSRRPTLLVLSLVSALLVGLMGLVGPSALPADALTDAQLKARQKAAQAAAAEAQEGLDDTSERAAAAAAELEQVQAQQPAVQAALDTAQAQVRAAQDEDVRLAGELAAAQAAEQVAVDELAQGEADLEAAQKRVSRLVSAAYRGGAVESGLAVVVGGDGPSDLADRLALVDTAARVQSASTSRLAQVKAEQQHRAEKLEAVRAQVAELKEQAAAHVVETQKAEAAAQKAKDDLAALEATKAQALADIEAQKKAFEQQVAAANAESDDIAAQLRARARSRGSSSSGGTAAPQRGLLGNPLASMTVTSSFGYRIHPVYHVRRLHAGTDLRAACGTPVYAAADGEVVRAGPGTGYGNILVIDHGTVGGHDVATAYAHLTRFASSVGQDVKKGQLVAYSGSTGVGTACHLHFEVRVDGTPTDPMAGWL